MKNLKLQSAMEYLMTYGWAILIIAVVMVALFSLGILGGSPLGTTCLPQSGFECTNPVFSHANGELSATLGQNSGTNWVTSNIVFVPQGVPTSNIDPNYFVGNSISVGAVNNGQVISVTDLPIVTWSPCNGCSATAPVTLSTAPAVGYTQAGTIWAMYTVPGSPTEYFAEVATVTLKAA